MELQRFFAQALRQPSGQDYEDVRPAEKLGPAPSRVHVSMGAPQLVGFTGAEPQEERPDPSMELHFDPASGGYVQQQAAGIVRIPQHDAQRMMERQGYAMGSEWPGGALARR